MLFDKFKKIVVKSWRNYVKETRDSLSNGHITVSDGWLLYPNLILFVKTEDHYLAEIFGAKKNFSTLSQKTHKSNLHTSEYLYQFSSRHIEGSQNGGSLKLNASANRIRGMGLMRGSNLMEFKKRFPFVSQWQPQLLCQGDDAPVLVFGENFKSTYMANCLLLNKKGNIYRAKSISHLIIVSKTILQSQLEEELKEELSLHGIGNHLSNTPNLVGMQLCGEEKLQKQLISGQFSNMYLNPGIRENTIDKFLEENDSILKNTFKATKIIPHPELKWLEGNPDTNENSIKPDFLLRRRDGFYDICDIKTIVEKRKNITRGKHRRRRFIDYVNEGIAQLANYEDYFKQPKNAHYAKEKYNVTVNKPKLKLVVGSYENVKKEEIEEAKRAIKDNIEIVDYDTLSTCFCLSD